MGLLAVSFWLLATNRAHLRMRPICFLFHSSSPEAEPGGCVVPSRVQQATSCLNSVLNSVDVEVAVGVFCVHFFVE